MSGLRMLAGLSVVTCMLAVGCSDNKGASGATSLAGTQDKQLAAQSASATPEYVDKQGRLRRAMEGLNFANDVVSVDDNHARRLVDRLAGASAIDRIDRGRAYLQRNQEIDAIAAFRDAILLDENSVDAFRGLADALTYKGKTDEAAAALRTAIVLDPASAQTRFNLGMAMVRKADNQAAIDAFDSVLAIDPNFAEAHVRLAIIYYYQGDIDAAWDHVDTAEALGESAPPQFIALLEKANGGTQG